MSQYIILWVDQEFSICSWAVGDSWDGETCSIELFSDRPACWRTPEASSAQVLASPPYKSGCVYDRDICLCLIFTVFLDFSATFHTHIFFVCLLLCFWPGSTGENALIFSVNRSAGMRLGPGTCTGTILCQSENTLGEQAFSLTRSGNCPIFFCQLMNNLVLDMRGKWVIYLLV